MMIEALITVIVWELARRLTLRACRDAAEGTTLHRIGLLLVGGGPRPKR